MCWKKGTFLARLRVGEGTNAFSRSSRPLPAKPVSRKPRQALNSKPLKQCVVAMLGPCGRFSLTVQKWRGQKESSYGATLLHLAAKQGSVPLMDTLVRHGSSLDARDSIGRTPLHCALAAGKLQAARWLIEKGANWRLEGEGGLTCLHAAAISDNPALVELRVQKGVSVNAVSLLGPPCTPRLSRTRAKLLRSSFAGGSCRCNHPAKQRNTFTSGCSAGCFRGR